MNVSGKEIIQWTQIFIITFKIILDMPRNAFSDQMAIIYKAVDGQLEIIT